jgi:hypothetical protein
MRTLQTLRSSFIDGQKLIECNMVQHADEQAETTALTVATYPEALESGFYKDRVLTGPHGPFNNPHF